MALRRNEEITITPSGILFVRPEPREGVAYAVIYRAGNGLRWAQKKQAFHAAEPSRWGHAELLLHIGRILADECGETLHVSDSTRWTNVPDELIAVLRPISAKERVCCLALWPSGPAPVALAGPLAANVETMPKARRYHAYDL